MRPTAAVLAVLPAFFLAAILPAAAETVTVAHALAEFGTPRHGADFAHFDYAEPAARKGGSVTLIAPGSFDSLNRLPLTGEHARSVDRLVFDTLMVQPQDELSVYYGLIAESVEYPEDRSWVVFTLRPEARFHDGRPIAAEDVAWTFEQIRAHGEPFLKSLYEDVSGVTVLGPRRVRFDVATRNVMKPLVSLAALTVRPKHWWTAEGRDISGGSLEPPLGSGPYRLVRVEPGRDLVYERVADYWAAELPVRRGQFNFDRITYNYYRDRDVAFEAFKGGDADFRREFTSRQWAAGYELDAVADGTLRKAEFPTVNFSGMQGFFMNSRRPPFDDIRVREAMQYLYPFEWVNRTIMYGLYKRTESWFPNSDYAATGLPEGLERDILERYRGRIPEAVFTQELRLPVNTEPNVDRANLRAARRLLEEAGWQVVHQRLVDVETGEPMRFELLMSNSGLEPHTQPLIRNLERVGVEATIRIVDSAQFQNRYLDRDFDMISFAFTFYPPPGGEMRSRFGSAAAELDGSANVIGIRDPVADELIELAVTARDLETKQAATRALDRVLMRGHYAIPHWNNDRAWIAWWDRFGFPENHPTYDFGKPNTIGSQPTWWIDPERDARLAEVR
ncbi:MAG: ABC transporter substrate-binding protein, partial [Inquilinus sp.]|nr:ABC transporter substrate-binding protein [Inquilinus sp.]